MDALLFHTTFTFVSCFALHKDSKIKCYMALGASPGTLVMRMHR